MSATGRSPARLAQDVYPTPAYCVDKLLPWLDLNGRDGEPLTFFEPCRGDGAIYDRLPAEARKGHCEIREGTDYLATPVRRHDIIITNPPYSLALPFLRKSLSEADTVVYLLRLNFLGTAARKPFWDAVSADTPVHQYPSPAVRERGLGPVRVRVVSLGPRGEGFDSPPVSGALSRFMKTDAPEPTLRALSRPFPGRPATSPAPPGAPRCAKGASTAGITRLAGAFPAGTSVSLASPWSSR